MPLLDDSAKYTSNVGRSNRRSPSVNRRREMGGTVGQASWFSSIINLLNTIVGAGVLTMPLAMSQMGILLGSFVILWSATTAAFGLYLQARCAQYLERGSASFFALSQLTYPNAAVIFDAAISIKCFGVAVSYLIIIGDLMPGVIRGLTSADVASFLVDRHFWITAFMLTLIPLSFLRRLDSLKYTSMVSLGSIAYLVILVTYHFCAGDVERSDEAPIRVVHWAGLIPTLSSVPIIVFAYTCHQNMFAILNEIRDNSHFQTTSVLVTSNGTAAAIYLLVAIAGYLSFGNDVRGNIVGQYAPSLSSTIGRAAIVILVMFSYPLQIHPCRASIDAVMKWRPVSRSRNSGVDFPDSSPTRNVPLRPSSSGRKMAEESAITETRFAAITTAIIILSFIVAMTVQSLEAVLAYVGSTGSTSISFILPGLFYYKISDPDSPHHQRLLKQQDDYDGEEEETITGAGATSRESEGLLSGSGVLNSGISMLPSNTKAFRRKLLRKLSLALVVYGFVVMVVCLVTNTFFLAGN